MPTFGTVCDGIGCGHLAFVNAGFDCAWSFEIEPFPSAVLAARFPDVKNYGDMNGAVGMIERGEISAPDVLIGGTPCQAFSIAGQRKGLDDERGNLSLVFCRIVDATDDVRGRDGKPPCAVLWENVPGVLSDKGNAFGCFLGELSGAGCQLRPPGGRWRNAGCVSGPKRDIAWIVKDSQYFGVPQRRRRVFVVAGAGGFRPEEVLFEREGVRRDSPPSREKREGASRGIECGFTAGDFGKYKQGVGVLRARGGDLGGGSETLVCHTTGAGFWREGIGTLRAREQDSHENVVVMEHGQANAEIGKNVCPTLSCNHEVQIATYDMRGNGDGAPCVAIGVDEEQNAHVELMGCLKARERGGGFEGSVMTSSMQVRRLLPSECEALQGLPRNWTLIPWRGKPPADCPDGPRYKGIGNGQTVSVMQWLARRIKAEMTK